MSGEAEAKPSGSFLLLFFKKEVLASCSLSALRLRHGPCQPRQRPRRSAPLASLAPLFDVPHVAYVSLQKGRQSELARLHGAAPILNLGPELASREDTGTVLSGLDAVVRD